MFCFEVQGTSSYRDKHRHVERNCLCFSPVTHEKGVAHNRLRVQNFPDFLFVQAKRFKIQDDWTPIKLDLELGKNVCFLFFDLVVEINS